MPLKINYTDTALVTHTDSYHVVKSMLIDNKARTAEFHVQIYKDGATRDTDVYTRIYKY